jgi:hypothetical protein
LDYVSSPTIDVLDSFNHTSTQSTNDTAHSAFSSGSGLDRSGRVDARAGFGSVGVSASTSYAQSPAPFANNGDSYKRMQAGGTAIADFTDVFITGPGSGNISTKLQIHLDGFLNSTSTASTELDGIVGAAEITFGISINGTLVGSGQLDRSSTNGGSPQITASGLFVGFSGNGVVTTDSFLVPLNTAVTVRLQMTVQVLSNMQDTAEGAASSTGQFYQSLSFATDRPVFDLPVGYTANSVTGGIINNGYQPVPEPGTTALLLLFAPAALLLRRWSRGSLLKRA